VATQRGDHPLSELAAPEGQSLSPFVRDGSTVRRPTRHRPLHAIPRLRLQPSSAYSPCNGARLGRLLHPLSVVRRWLETDGSGHLHEGSPVLATDHGRFLTGALRNPFLRAAIGTGSAYARGSGHEVGTADHRAIAATAAELPARRGPSLPPDSPVKAQLGPPNRHRLCLCNHGQGSSRIQGRGADLAIAEPCRMCCDTSIAWSRMTPAAHDHWYLHRCRPSEASAVPTTPMR
jgi:hypothetical protein